MTPRILESLTNFSNYEKYISSSFNETFKYITNSTNYSPISFYISSRRARVNHVNISNPNEIVHKTGYLFSFGFLFIILLFGIVGRVIYSANDTVIHVSYLKYHRNTLNGSKTNSDNCTYQRTSH
ncbi:unnamed protein product [Brachionus calyciflorus]|uniref:Uncharacterized protein n=1 Tax=Brachionus calyciflorus TaxID=104777 RepID=A0A814B986_9BILA|nr:unnamed protein product [Brachionus calyciflorus]